MAIASMTTRAALVMAAMTGVVAVSDASAVNIITMGDSITAGVGSSDSQFRETSAGSGVWSSRGGSGYRKGLNDLLAQNGTYNTWNFIGTRNAPSTNTQDHPNIPAGTTYANNWNRHMGIPGTTASGLLTAVQGYDSANGLPDVALLHIGSNSSGSDMTTSPGSYTSGTAADAQLYRLLDGMRTSVNFGGVDKILVARIVPKANATDLTNIIDYNYSSTQGIAGAIAALPDTFEEKIEVVDLFKIGISNSMLSFLAQQTGELVADLQDMIDPFDTGYVDWLGGLNEATHQITGAITRNQYLYTDIIGFNGTNYVYGTSDGTHPSDLGYAVMSWAWGQAIPEPTALAMLVLGGALAATRRRPLA